MDKKFGSSEYRPTHEAIARRAQEIYLANGSKECSDVENWLQAEAQLRSEHEKATPEPQRPQVRAARARG